MKEDIITYKYENNRGDDITIEHYPNDHVRLIIDFVKPMELEELMKFTKVCGYKLKRAPLRLIKKGE